MAMKPIEEHLADFLLLMREPGMKDYRRRCLEHWREHYGPVIAAKVEAMVKERWKPKPHARSF
jgi:hypothetical protein